ncbi:hypothetical protein SAMN04487944_101560 [Gracilibacillus ureilyticus]|uniref:Zinc-finger n=2 Tax=Gracilibacillus ureilyticus TaxID=531814 RepID=A0A1H9M5N5_9BACI|nr:hypothetical protein SAMN04487944_101560 [Gracilibacillus ureilyticus]
MDHIPKEILNKYCTHQLSEDDQSRIDHHLTECEQCFSLYLEVIDNFTVEHSVTDTFTDLTITKIETSHIFDQDKLQKNKKRRIMGHYFLAAGLTLLFTFSGLFEEVIQITSETGKQKRISVSEQLMNKTNDILDQMKEENNK